MISKISKYFLICFLIINNDNFCSAALKNKILIKIENEIISSYELKNKINTIIVLSDKEINQVNINSLKKAAINQLINTKMKKIELSKYNIQIDYNNINNYLNNVSFGNVQAFKEKFIENNLDYNLYIEEVKIQLSWQKLIYSLYQEKVKLDDKDINTDLERIISKKISTKDFNLSEIDIILDQNEDFKTKIIEINKNIRDQGFEKTAKQFSSSYSASSGGSLGWLNENSLSNKIFNIISKLKKGQVSEPIISTNSIMFLKLNDVRIKKAGELNTEEIKNDIIKQKKNELFSLYSNSHLSKIKNNLKVEYK